MVLGNRTGVWPVKSCTPALPKDFTWKTFRGPGVSIMARETWLSKNCEKLL